MAWETLVSRKGGATQFGEMWRELPAVSVNQLGLILNKPAQIAFGLATGNMVQLMIDRASNRMAIQTPQAGDNKIGCFRLSKRDKDDPMKLHCAKIAKAFPFAVGRAYLAKLNPGMRVIEIDLSNGNCLNPQVAAATGNGGETKEIENGSGHDA